MTNARKATKKKSGRRQAEPDLFQTAVSATDSTSLPRFRGTDNLRQLRAIKALLRGPVTREQMDQASGASNGPAVVAALRKRGLSITCTLRECTDRDGGICRPGVYSFTAVDRAMVREWMSRCVG